MGSVRTERGIIVGGVSVLMIFLSISVAIYGLLSLLTTENELSLNLRNRDATIAYYRADAIVAEVISELASTSARSEDLPKEVQAIPVTYDITTSIATFTVPVDDFRNLDVSISFSNDGSHFEINSYRLASSMSWHEEARRGIIVLTEFD